MLQACLACQVRIPLLKRIEDVRHLAERAAYFIAEGRHRYDGTT